MNKNYYFSCQIKDFVIIITRSFQNFRYFGWDRDNLNINEKQNFVKRKKEEKGFSRNSYKIPYRGMQL